MATLITGGAGFIGSQLAKHLLYQGESVVVLDNFNDFYDPALKRYNVSRLNTPARLHVVEGDIRDKACIQKVFAEHEITHVAHMAAMANVRNSIKNTPLYTEVNVNGSVNILEAASAQGVTQMVMASTGSVYGKTAPIPFVETDNADRPLASYPATKRAMELMAHTYHNLTGLNVTVLRFFNVYGPAGRPDMMPMRLMNAALNGAEIPIYNDGAMQRDWTYIEDTVNGILAALAKPMGYEIFNLGYGQPVNLNDFVDIVEELTGKRINKRPTPAPASEPLITFCDNSKARRLLNFNPQVSVADGLKATWEWFREYKQA
jgi:UDP-glucuronate 4-epimerase